MKKVILLILAILLIGGGVYLIFIRKMPDNSVEGEDKIIGKYEHNINWQKDGKTVRTSYAVIEIKAGEWSYYGYSMKDGNKIRENKLEGACDIDKENNNLIRAHYEEDGTPYYIELYVDGDKICQGKEKCDNYFLKSTSKLSNVLTLEEIED